MSLKAQIKQARELSGLNKSELARACGVDPSAINKLESGDTKTVSGDLLLRINLATGVSPFALAGLKSPKPLTERTQRMAELFEQLPTAEQVKLLHYVAVQVELGDVSEVLPDLTEATTGARPVQRLR